MHVQIKDDTDESHAEERMKTELECFARAVYRLVKCPDECTSALTCTVRQEGRTDYFN